MYPVTLKRIESLHDNLRDDEVTGLAPELPKLGGRFFMYAEAKDRNSDIRYIRTSEVQSMELLSGGSIGFKTQNSMYELSYGPAIVGNSDDNSPELSLS